MKLGDILTRSRRGDAMTAPTKPVTFKVLGRDADGVLTTAEAHVVLAFVDDQERAEALRAAEKALRADFPDGDAPPELLTEERTYQVLVRALRDEDDPRAPFAESVRQLRGALHHLEFSRLLKVYEQFVAEEFPEVVTPEQLDQLVDEASNQ
jgi:hypothetical protein